MPFYYRPRNIISKMVFSSRSKTIRKKIDRVAIGG
jgi:hypothetical protein